MLSPTVCGLGRSSRSFCQPNPVSTTHSTYSEMSLNRKAGGASTIISYDDMQLLDSGRPKQSSAGVLV
jgi:hypothetical protein